MSPMGRQYESHSVEDVPLVIEQHSQSQPMAGS